MTAPAVRTTPVAVRNILRTNLSAEELMQFIQDAALWVTESPMPAALSPGRLEMIERYLACALVRVRELGLVSARFDDVSEQYQVDPNVTDYLLRAASFDPTGTIRKAFLTPASVRVAGGWRGKGFTEEAR